MKTPEEEFSVHIGEACAQRGRTKSRLSKACMAIGVTCLLSLSASPQQSTLPETSQGTHRKTAGWTPEAMMKVRQVTAVEVSPDGQRVVYSADEAIMGPETSEYRLQIYLANADGTGEFQLTYGDKSNSSPQWSPDGQWIAFISDRSGKSNIWLMRARGGEPEMLTDMKTGVISFKWSPDGRSIAFLSPDPASADQERSTRAKDDAWVVDENTTITRRLTPHRLWLIPVGSGGHESAARLLTPGDYSVGYPFEPAKSSFDWSPDGTKIVFTHAPSAKANDWTKADISIVDVETSTATSLVRTGAAEHSPLYSPDGRWIAYLASDDPPTWSFDEAVRVIPVVGGSSRALAETYDHKPSLVGWNPDSQGIIFSEAHGTATAVTFLPLSGPLVELNRLVGNIKGLSLNFSRTMLGFSFEELDHAPEAFVSPSNSFRNVQVSHLNVQLPTFPLGRTEVIRWKSGDGLEIEGLLTYPVDYRKGQRYPMVLAIHGGPQAVFLQDYTATGVQFFPVAAIPVAAMASKGYVVLRCNIRGSSGYGKRFRFLNRGDWGGMDYKDLMAGVDHVIQMGLADPNRLGVIGGSYGGFMTSWIVTQTRRFRAAVIAEPVTDLISFTGTTDVPDFIPDIFGGEPWEIPDVYRAHSPLFFAKEVKTPALIMAGEIDDRAPALQSYEFYNALKHAGCETQMVIWPRSGHGPPEPKLLLDAMNRILEWYDRYVKP